MSKEVIILKSKEDIEREKLIEELKLENQSLKQQQELMQSAIDDLILGGAL